MYMVLENGCEITQCWVNGVFTEVGMISVNDPGMPEAWLIWMEGQSIVSKREWRQWTRERAIHHINVWLEPIGLILQENEIVALSPEKVKAIGMRYVTQEQGICNCKNCQRDRESKGAL